MFLFIISMNIHTEHVDLETIGGSVESVMPYVSAGVGAACGISCIAHAAAGNTARALVSGVLATSMGTLSYFEFNDLHARKMSSEKTINVTADSVPA